MVRSRQWGDAGPVRVGIGHAVVIALAVVAVLGAVRRADAAGHAEAGEPPIFVSAADDVACPAACCRTPHVLDPLGLDPVWSGRAEALLLWRESPQGLVLFDNATGGAALDAGQLGSGMAAGPRFTLFRHTGDDGAIEFNYLRVQTFDAGRDVPATDGGYLQTDHGIFCCPSDIPIDRVATSMSSALQSFELNRRFPTDGGWQWLTGFRWVEWREGIAIDSSSVGGAIVDTYASSTFNDLYGWQFGADSILCGLGGPFRVEGLGKAGVYYNNAVQSSVRTTNATLPPTSLAVGSTLGQAAFVGEVGLTAVYDVADWLSVRAGYAAFWLSGLAQAPNQLFAQDLCPDNAIAGRTVAGSSVWIQGITVGLEARY